MQAIISHTDNQIHAMPSIAMAGSLPNLNVENMAENFAEFNSKRARSLTDLTDLRWREKSGKIVEKLNFDNYLVKVEGGRKMTRGNGRFSTSTVKEKVYTVDGESKKADVGVERKVGDGRDRDKRKDEDRLRKRYNW